MNLKELINLYVFPTGRREFCMYTVRETADGLEWVELVSLCDEALAHEQDLCNKIRELAAARQRRPIRG